jgi:hypothetical protein
MCGKPVVITLRDKQVFCAACADRLALSVYLGPFYVPTPIARCWLPADVNATYASALLRLEKGRLPLKR